MLSAIGFVAHPLPANAGASLEYGIAVSDIDGDGDMDIVSANAETIFWQENTNGGEFAVEHPVANVEEVTSIVPADIDGDGDEDILFSSSSLLGWSENIDDSGDFGSVQVLDESRTFRDVLAVDIDDDGDVDVVFNLFPHRLFWIENLDGEGGFGSATEFGESSEFAVNDLEAGDMDGDGDLDILVGQSSSGKGVSWHENAGAGTFEQEHEVATGPHNLGGVEVADVDGDGDADVLVYGLSGLFWAENVGLGRFSNGGGPTETLKTLAAFGPVRDIVVTDIDLDGDVDVLSVGLLDFSFSEVVENGLVLHENIGGDVGFAEPQVIAGLGMIRQTVRVPTGDFDNDGDTDLVISRRFLNAGETEVTWYENRIPGDTNDDRVVDFSDFLALSEHFGKEVDAVWEEGDFDGSGHIDFSDFLALAANFGRERSPDEA